jgi:hypothetical protein
LVLNTDSAKREAVEDKAHLAGNGLVLAKRCNAVGDRFTFRPKGDPQMFQTCVAALEKDMPFSSFCALF